MSAHLCCVGGGGWLCGVVDRGDYEDPLKPDIL